MNGFLEDLKGSFGILSNADVMSYLLRGLMFTLVISVIAIVFSLLLQFFFSQKRGVASLRYLFSFILFPAPPASSGLSGTQDLLHK